MQNDAQSTSEVSGRLLGIVRVVVGGHVCDLAVQSVPFVADTAKQAGGFFVQGDTLGIIVDDAATAAQVQAQIERGTAEAVRHLSRKYLN
jgi:hypothetical protein